MGTAVCVVVDVLDLVLTGVDEVDDEGAEEGVADGAHFARSSVDTNPSGQSRQLPPPVEYFPGGQSSQSLIVFDPSLSFAFPTANTKKNNTNVSQYMLLPVAFLVNVEDTTGCGICATSLLGQVSHAAASLCSENFPCWQFLQVQSDKGYFPASHMHSAQSFRVVAPSTLLLVCPLGQCLHVLCPFWS